MTFYTEMQDMAAELLAEFSQGVIVYTAPPVTSGDAWNPTTTTPGTEYTLDATVRGVSSQYVDGVSILATDKEVTAAVFAVTPSPSGSITIDGQVLQIVRLLQLPAAGTPSVYKFICRA